MIVCVDYLVQMFDNVVRIFRPLNHTHFVNFCCGDGFGLRCRYSMPPSSKSIGQNFMTIAGECRVTLYLLYNSTRSSLLHHVSA